MKTLKKNCLWAGINNKKSNQKSEKEQGATFGGTPKGAGARRARPFELFVLSILKPLVDAGFSQMVTIFE